MLVLLIVVPVIGRRWARMVWLPTCILAFAVLAAVTGWLRLVEPGASHVEALKTGGLAAASVVALYGLWLNDRRRRVEERRQEQEDLRIAHDRERVADERFAKSVELLGHAGDQVRLGAMHALANLARSRREYTQTVLDVLCAYLRRPFALGEDDLEKQVRLTAQRLVGALLPAAGSDGPDYDLDLTGATLEYLDLSGRRIGELTMRRANLHQATALYEAEIRGPAWFTAATAHYRFVAHRTTFHDKAWFSGFVAVGPADFSGARFLGETKFSRARFQDTMRSAAQSSPGPIPG
ncbi:pentapeptide repeat-containing protein [Kutzneria viridogrisea]